MKKAFGRPVERVGIPKTTEWRMKKEQEGWRKKIMEELEWLGTLEAAGKKEIESLFSSKEWYAIIASMNGEALNFNPAFNEGDTNFGVRNFSGDALVWNFTEWCRYNASEASQFGDPAVLASSVGDALRKLSPIAKYIIIRLSLGYWSQLDEADDRLSPKEWIEKNGIGFRIERNDEHKL